MITIVQRNTQIVAQPCFTQIAQFSKLRCWSLDYLFFPKVSKWFLISQKVSRKALIQIKCELFTNILPTRMLENCTIHSP